MALGTTLIVAPAIGMAAPAHADGKANAECRQAVNTIRKTVHDVANFNKEINQTKSQCADLVP